MAAVIVVSGMIMVTVAVYSCLVVASEADRWMEQQLGEAERKEERERAEENRKTGDP